MQYRERGWGKREAAQALVIGKEMAGTADRRTVWGALGAALVMPVEERTTPRHAGMFCHALLLTDREATNFPTKQGPHAV